MPTKVFWIRTWWVIELLFYCHSLSLTCFPQECQAKALDNHSSWCAVSQQLNEIAKKSDCDEDLLRFVLALALRQPSRSEHSKKV